MLILVCERLAIASPVERFRPKVGQCDNNQCETMLTDSGYWMPFEAAKAVAATFCYSIRHVLTPVFGKDFLSLCIQPTKPDFGSFKIREDIIRRCTAQTHQWHTLERLPSPEAEKSRAPNEDEKISSSPKAWPKTLRPRPAKVPDVESGYGTDTDRSDQYHCSPKKSPQYNRWTPINSCKRPDSSDPSTELFSPKPWLWSIPRSSVEDRPRPKVRQEDLDGLSSIDASPKSSNQPIRETEELYGKYTATEIRAAYMLMQLSVADEALSEAE